MSLTRFVQPIDRRAASIHLGALLRLAAPVLAVPALVALLAREWPEAASFAAVAAAAGGLGAWHRGRTGVRARSTELCLRDALVVTAVAYLVFAGLGALPLLRHGPPIDAFFEALSGFTTTGLGLLEVERLPRSVLFFRAWSQWVGGAGICVLSIAVLFPPGRAAARLQESEAAGGGLVGSVVATARVVLVAYAALTAGAIVLLALAGSSPWEALLHGLAAISTGGFSPRPGGLSSQDGLTSLAALVLVMLVGATPIHLWPIARRQGRRALLGDPQVRLLLGLAALASLLFAATASFAPEAWLPAITEAVSALSTTGFSVGDPAQWGDSRKLLATALMIVGGSTGSTAGGLKLLRLVLLLRVVGWVLRRAQLPREATVPLTLGGEPIGEHELRQAGAVAGLHLLVVAVGAVALTCAGGGALDALFESASATGTVGLSAGITSPALPAWAKLVLCAQMCAGRLELLPLLVLCHPRTWFAKEVRA